MAGCVAPPGSAYPFNFVRSAWGWFGDDVRLGREVPRLTAFHAIKAVEPQNTFHDGCSASQYVADILAKAILDMVCLLQLSRPAAKAESANMFAPSYMRTLVQASFSTKETAQLPATCILILEFRIQLKLLLE